MSVALRGNLRDFGIADVFQLIGQQRKTGVLEFTNDGDEGVQLRFDGGNVVSAAPITDRAEQALGEMLVRCGRLTQSQLDRLKTESEATAQTLPRLAVSRGWIEQEEVARIEDLLTRETLFDVLRWESGEFDFRSQPVEHTREMESLLGAEQILMDSLRMVDEWHSFCELVHEDAVFRRSSGVEEYRRRTELQAEQVAQAERVFALVDGRTPVRKIVDLSLLGTFDAVRLLADLRRYEVIELLDPEALESLRSLPAPASRAARETLGDWLVGAAPLLALALLAAWIGTRETRPPIAPGFSLHSEAHGEVVAAYATRRAHHALEAHRFLTGAWPESLDQVSRGGLLADAVLAVPDASSYYYAKRDGGVLLLAPAR
ncbi:MAG: DUF4388 domain-containing protein [Deltaproteobacteria bacterium]|nr:DUF4388 domain-containing protein [Deltaproteobacteria bacterium]MBW2360390.1 DUF4388 domain-containing protein [Deltaproteobacteria bacterium]